MEINQMQTRVNFLSLMLLDALEDENAKDVYDILGRNDVNPCYAPAERGIAPIHYVCGMPNTELALDVLKLILEMGNDVNVQCESGLTPLHIAVFYGRTELVSLLLNYGASIEVCDDERKTPAHYAIEECQFDIVVIIRDHIFRQKSERQRQERKNRTNNATTFQLKTNETDDEMAQSQQKTQLANSIHNTPKRGNNRQLHNTTPNTTNQLYYNKDTASPYYINITHRRYKPQPKFAPEAVFGGPENAPQEFSKAVNLLTLTKDNLAELAEQSNNSDELKSTLIESWRQKVERSRVRKSLFNANSCTETNIDAGLCVTRDAFASEKLCDEAVKHTKCIGIDEIAAAETSYFSAADHLEPPRVAAANDLYRDQLIRSPTSKEYFLQMAEGYVHTDDENGLVFYEKKLPSNISNIPAVQQQEQQERVQKKERSPTPTPAPFDENLSKVTQSTNLTLPLDYETDALRVELTRFGECVGPITKTTKRLYIKRLIKYKRNAQSMWLQRRAGIAARQEQKYTVELQRTLRTTEEFMRIQEFYALETASAAYFANVNTHNNGTQKTQRLREGNLKQSFIYLLIDPLISCNLPGESAFLDNFIVWRRFLDSIFYVGKGKSTRPYAHLYEAMKVHAKLEHKKRDFDAKELTKLRFSDAPTTPSKKLKRILNIWAEGQGVVCLHVFHNIMPTDAYTREAAMIEALALKSLTNIKRGDYYGPARSWSMKQKKHMGIALLYKAMQIYLAEGESQLAPCDLVEQQ